MPDISKCVGVDCPLRDTCYRYTSKPDKYWQSYGDFSFDKENNECKYYWKNERVTK